MTRIVARFPVATVALGVVVSLLALTLTFGKLGFRANRLDLLNPESDYNRLWIEYIEEFGDEDDAVIVVEGDSREHVMPVLKELSQALARNDQLFHAVLHEVDLSKIRAKGLYYLSREELQGLDGFVGQVAPIVGGHWSQLNLAELLGAACARLEDPQASVAEREAAMRQLERLAHSMSAAAESVGHYQSPWPSMPQSFATLSELSGEYLLTKEGRLGFVILRLARGADEFAPASEATDALRTLIDRVAVHHPEAKIGLTGLPVMENDEMRASKSSMFWASLLSMGAVACLFVAGFGGLRHALLANIALLMGMAWAFGYATLAVGHLNILSVSFTVTMIGIGIDFGIHYAARYMQLRRQGWKCQEALVETSQRVGPAIVAGGVTVAVAFFAAGWTSFIGVAELGIIAGGGVLLCAAAELILLPAMIAIVDDRAGAAPMPLPLPVHSWIAPLARIPRLVTIGTIGLTLVVLSGVNWLWYDHNLLNMQPDGLESVELERKLLSESDQSVWYALSIADSREELLARKAAFLELSSVERTEEIVSLLPPDHEMKQPLIRNIRAQLETLPERPKVIHVTSPDDLGRLLGRAQRLIAEQFPRARTIYDLEQARDRLRRLSVEECFQIVSTFQQQMAGDLLSRLHVLASMADPAPPQLSDLPESLVSRFVGEHGKHLLKIYGHGNLWDMDALKQFVTDVRKVDPRATGNPLQAYEASIEMKQSYERAALYALVVITVVLLVDFRSIRHTLLAMFPLGLGMAQMFGLMGLIDIPLNPANMIALPLILGIGVDYGVHIVHDYREQRGPYRMSSSTALAVIVDALTTIVGFGALMIASHRGLQSLGRVLTIGVTCCLFASMTTLPALLTWLTRNRLPAEADEAGDHEGGPRGGGPHAARRAHEPSVVRLPAAREHAPSRTPVQNPNRRVA